MRLMEATKIGCDIYPRKIRGATSDGRGGACWLGAVWVGSNGVPEWFDRRFDEPAECPECHKTEGVGAGWGSPHCVVLDPDMYWSRFTTPVRLGVHLNNAHDWTREQISAYISQWEPTEEPVPVEAAVVEEEAPVCV